MALPALLSGLGRQLIVQGAKGAAKGAAKKMLSGKAKERNNNSIVKRQESPKVGYKKSSALVPISRSINFGSPPSSPEVSSSTKGADGSLLTIKEKVIRIENLLGEQYKNRKKQAEKQRKLSERVGRKEKEELLEKTPQEKKNKGKFNIPIPGKGLFDNLMSRVFNFLFWVAIGKMLPTIIKFLPQIMGFLKVIANVMNAVINVAGFILDGFISFVDFGFKVYDKIRGFAGAIGGEGLVKVLDGFTSAVETLLNLLFIISMASAVGGGFGGGKGGRKGGGQTPRTRPGQGLRPKVTTTGGGGAGRPDIRNPLRDRPRVTTTGGGTAGRPDIRNPFRQRPPVTGTGGGGKFKIPKFPKIPGGGIIRRFAGPVINTLLAIWDFRSRKSAGQTDLQAGVGTGGGVLGGIAATALAATLFPEPFSSAAGLITLGILGAIGYNVGSTVADKATGADQVGQYQDGGEVVDGEESKVKESKTEKFKLKKLLISDLSDSDIDSNKLAKIYKPEGVLKIIELANDLKSVPIVGGAMYAALSLALGEDVNQNVTKSIAYDLVSFSNLDSFENISSSISGLESIIAMNTGGEVSKMVAESSSDSEQSATSLSIFLDRKFNSQEIGKVTEEDEKKAKQKPWWDLFGTTEGSTSGKGTPGASRDSATGEPVPGSTATGGGVVGGPGTPEQKALLDAVSFAEGTSKSYGTIFGGNVIPELERGELTVAQVLEMQRTGKLNGRDVGYGTSYDSDATGRYQFMSYVLKEEVQKQGVPMDAMFTPALQDKLILGRLARFRGVTPELLAKEGLSTNVLDKLAPEFASFPYSPKGNQSYYDQPVKTPESIRKAYNDALGRRKEEEKQQSAQTTSVPQSEPPGQTPSTSSSSNERGEGSKLAGELGRFLDSKGLGVWGSGVHQHPEHPPWPKESGHSANSLHYESQGARAIDIGGWGPKMFKRKGESGTDDQTKIISAINKFNSSKGASPVEFLHEGNEPSGHSDHVHIAYEGGGLIRPRGSMSVPNSFTSYNSPSANTKVVMVPIAVPVSKPQMSSVLENSMGGFVEFGEVNSMGSRMNSIHQTSRS